MTVPTRSVTCIAADARGAIVPRAQFVFTLNTTEIYQGFMVPGEVSIATGEDGVGVVQLWPNVLGTQGSLYRVTGTDLSTGQQFLSTTCTVPDSDCYLHEIRTAIPSPDLTAAEEAMLFAQAAVAQAHASADASSASAVEAAGYATNSSSSALASAGSAVEAAASALAASGSADAAALSASTASTKAGEASASAQAAEVARQGAVTAQNNAVAVVTGGTASLTPAPGKIPLADANGRILAWIAETVQYAYPGSGAVSVVVNPALNSNLGGFANVIAGGGALNNPQIINYGNYNTISGGYDNQTSPASGGASSSEANTIAGGAHHRMEAGVNHGTIMGGSYGLIKADVTYATIGGGSSHTITGMSGTVSGGAQNTAGRDATVGGGTANTASGRYSVVAGGTLNTASADVTTIAGGNNNSAGGGGGSVGGGVDNNIAAGLYNTVGGGYQNVLGTTASSSYSTIGGGRGNSIQTGQYACIPGGYLNSATADYGVATGTGARSYLRGMVAHSAASNTSQLGSLHLYRQTTTGTEADLLLDGSSAYPVLPESSLIGFMIHICAARTDVVGEFAWYVYRGVVKREGANTAVILGSTLVDSYETTAAWSTRLAIVNGNFRIAVTGETGKTIRWSARMDMIEQLFA